jgi:hypothetical protein
MKRPGRVAKALRKLCLAWAVALLCPALANAETIENTASVSFTRSTGEAVTLQSNTVVTEVLPLPAPASIEFRRYDPGAPGGTTLPFDGGQCMVAGGEFKPLPAVRDDSGSTVDPGSSETDAAQAFYVGEPLVVAVTDANRNADPAVRDSLEVELTTTTGESSSIACCRWSTKPRSPRATATWISRWTSLPSWQGSSASCRRTRPS